MLASLVVVSVVALPLATVSVFSPFARLGPSWLATALGATLLADIAATAAVVLGVATGPAAIAGGVLAATCIGWKLLTPRWGAAGRLAWGTAAMAGAVYLAYVLAWTLQAGLGPVSLMAGLLLWILELMAYLLGLVYVWETVDVLASGTWARRLADGDEREIPNDHLPFVSVHVPAHNEPPEMVIATLQSLLAMDYPAFEIVMVDDNTTDRALWEPVADFCRLYPDKIKFYHLENWPGFKSGALNFALTVTDPRAEVVGVVDADYLVERDYLRRCASLFARNRRLGFVQTPQDYRDWQNSPYFRRLYHSYAFFFAVSQVSRNEHDGAIFGGTMGLIRRRALQAVGGWDEWCITEDAELSLRLLRAGWTGRHVDRSFGKGVMPLTFDALKRQRFRWCFGGIQILRMHWRSLLPFNRDSENYLSLAQRWSYLSGGLQWYADLLGLAFSTLLVAGVLDLAFGNGLVFRRLSGLLLVAVPLLGLLNLARSITLLRRTTHASWREAVGAFGLWLALGWTVATASVRGLTAPAGVFLRTPKTRSEGSWIDAVRVNRVEVALAAIGLGALATTLAQASGVVRVVLTLMLLQPILGLLAAPINTVAALRAELPDELRRRRRTERGRAWASGPLRPTRLAGGGILATASVAALLMIVLPFGNAGSLPDPLSQARGKGPATVGGDNSTTTVPTTGPTPDAVSATSATPTQSATVVLIPEPRASATTAPTASLPTSATPAVTTPRPSRTAKPTTSHGKPSTPPGRPTSTP